MSVAFVGDQAMRSLNKAYRRKDKPTDVLSFVYKEKAWPGEPELLGEIVIDYQQIKRQAKPAKKSERQELVFILVHGLLHLAGYDDKTERERLNMIKIGEEFIHGYLGKI